MKPIILYSHTKGPNPWKVALILEELGLPYETRYLEFDEAKREPYLSINPNGKLPSIEDPNQNLHIFESGAIIEYLIEQYDQGGLLRPASLQDQWLARSWLHLQVSAQHPPAGLKLWMNRTHPSADLAAANAFLEAEIRRVMGVMDAHLAGAGGRPYLLGQTLSYADLCYVPLYHLLPLFVPGLDIASQNEFPHLAAWWKRLVERPAVQKIFKTRAALA